MRVSELNDEGRKAFRVIGCPLGGVMKYVTRGVIPYGPDIDDAEAFKECDARGAADAAKIITGHDWKVMPIPEPERPEPKGPDLILIHGAAFQRVDTFRLSDGRMFTIQYQFDPLRDAAGELLACLKDALARLACVASAEWINRAKAVIAKAEPQQQHQ